MFEKLLKPFTTAEASGTVFRDSVIAFAAILTILGTLGILSQDQVDAIMVQVNKISDPKVLASLGILMGIGMSWYRAVFRSRSDKADAVAKMVDKELPKMADVTILTPGDQPNITIPATKTNP